MKVLITGAGGMLGKDVYELMSKDDNFQVYPLDKNPLPYPNAIELDITSDKNVVLEKIAKINPEVIIHCAAYTDVKWCEQANNHEATDKLHVDATRTLASHNRARFIYISTDSVFDGSKGNYSEEDIPNPQNYYALSKLKGEKAALESNKNAIILRTNIYGFHNPPGNSLAEWAIINLSDKRNNKKINGWHDVDFNPLYTKQLARIINKVIMVKELPSILNVAAKDTISKYDFLLKMASVFGFNKSLINRTSVDANNNLKEKRSKHTSLDISKMKIFLNESPSIDDGLRELKTDYSQKML